MKGPKMEKRAFCIVAVEVLLLAVWVTAASAQQPANQLSETEKSTYSPMTGLPDWMSIAGYADFSYRTTQFFKPDYDTTFLQGDGRLEFWIPPGRETFSWGPYIRLAEQMVTARKPGRTPGWPCREPGSRLTRSVWHRGERNDWFGGLLGPLRLFAEYNRPITRMTRTRATGQPASSRGRVLARNLRQRHDEASLGRNLVGLFWQSANEFDPHYNTVIFANALRRASECRTPACYPGSLRTACWRAL